MLSFFDPVTTSYLRAQEDAEARTDEERAGRRAAELHADSIVYRVAELDTVQRGEW